MFEKGDEGCGGNEEEEGVALEAGGMEEAGEENEAKASSSRETNGTEEVDAAMRGAGDVEGMPPADEYEEGGV